MSSFTYASYDDDTQQSADPDKSNLVRIVKNAGGSVSLVVPGDTYPLLKIKTVTVNIVSVSCPSGTETAQDFSAASYDPFSLADLVNNHINVPSDALFMSAMGGLIWPASATGATRKASIQGFFNGVVWVDQVSGYGIPHASAFAQSTIQAQNYQVTPASMSKIRLVGLQDSGGAITPAVLAPLTVNFLCSNS